MSLNDLIGCAGGQSGRKRSRQSESQTTARCQGIELHGMLGQLPLHQAGDLRAFDGRLSAALVWFTTHTTRGARRLKHLKGDDQCESRQPCFAVKLRSLHCAWSVPKDFLLDVDPEARRIETTSLHVIMSVVDFEHRCARHCRDATLDKLVGIGSVPLCSH